MRRRKWVQNVVVATLSLIVVLFGVLPILTRDDSDLEKFGYKSEKDYDVIVFGTEPEGIAAAIAAARAGLRTALFTSEPDPGSYMTDCLINSMSPQTGRIEGRNTTFSGAVFADMFGTVENTYTSAEWMDNILHLLERESNLEVNYQSTLVGVQTIEKEVVSVSFYTRSGTLEKSASIYLDATEDGVLLERLEVPYTLGAADIGAAAFYEPVALNFRILGVPWEEIQTIAKVGALTAAFQELVYAYPRTRSDIKLVRPTFIRQEEDGLLVTGLQVAFVNVGDYGQVQQAYQIALREAMHLAAYLKTELPPFENAEWDVAAARLFVPEYRHYEGQETLEVADILLNRDRPDKVAVLSEPVSAGRFTGGDSLSVLCEPNAYAVPIGALVPKGWQNVMMPGRNASFSSLASTSATTVSARTVVGEGAGLAAAFCVLERIQPADIRYLPEDRLKEFVAFLSRAGQRVPDFYEPVVLEDGTALQDSWVLEDVVALVGYGVLLGGSENRFRLGEGCSNEVLAVLAKNALIRMAPSQYGLDLETALSHYATKEQATTTTASELLLTLAGQNRQSGITAEKQLLQWLEREPNYRIPEEVAQEWSTGGTATNAVLYHLVHRIGRQLGDDNEP